MSLALALNGALASPLRARDYAVVTVTELATQVVHITSTTWVDPAQYNPTEVPTPPTSDPNEKHKYKSHVTTNTPSTTLSTTTPTTISTPSTSIPTTTSLPTTSLSTTTSIPTTTSELSTSIPSLLPASTSISVPTSIQVPTTLEKSTLPVPTTPISTPPVKIESSTTPPAPAPTLGNTPSGSDGGTTYSGQGTFYNTGLGSCGITSQDTDFICAISAPLYDAQGAANPNNNPLCGKKIKVSYKGGTPVTVTIVDRCPECAKPDLDLSPAAFKAMGASPDQGRVDITWSYAS